MRRFIRMTGSLVAILGLCTAYLPQHTAAAAFQSNILMDDAIFNATSSMNAGQIDAFLNGFANSCISPNSGFRAIDPTGYNPTNGYQYGGYVTAGQVIYDAGQAYGLNPQVLLTTLEKEQSLVTGRNNFAGYCNNGDQHKYAAAVGYGCPDSGTTYSYDGLSLYQRNGTVVSSTGTTCVTSGSKAGFSQQVIRAAWLFKFGQQRALGNIGWAVIQGNWNNSDDPQTCYGGPMTQGTFQRCPSGASTYYDGYYTIDNTAVHIDSGATGALYWYTPHFSGNQSFDNLFSNWFGGVIGASYYSCHNATNVSNAPSGQSVIRNSQQAGGPDTLSIIAPNNTGSACIEVHTWADSNYQTWLQHIASNAPAVDPTNVHILAAHPSGTRTDNLYEVAYAGTGSGRIEIHGWTPLQRGWASHVATNMPVINPADGEVIAADFNGSGRDSFYLVQYRNTGSGMVEVHGWSPDLQQWSSHVATSLPAIDPTQGSIISADLNGDGRDELVYIKYAGTQSGQVEVHALSGPNLQQWTMHAASVLPAVGYTPSTDSFVAADTTGSRQDKLLYVKYRGTASGKVEVHTLSADMRQWTGHSATSSPSF